MVSSQSALRGQGPLFLTHASMHGRAQHTSVWAGLAEISWMTLGRENDASSSSHPEPPLSALSQATLQVPVTIRPAPA